MTIFGDRAFEEVIKVKWGHEVGALGQYDWCKGETHQTGMCLHREAMWTQWEDDYLQVRREVSPETSPAGTLTLTFQNWENKFLLSFCCGRTGKLIQGLWGKAPLFPLFRWRNWRLERRSLYFWQFKVSRLSSFVLVKSSLHTRVWRFLIRGNFAPETFLNVWRHFWFP